MRKSKHLSHLRNLKCANSVVGGWMIIRLRLCRRIGRFIFNRSLMLLSANSLLRGIVIYIGRG